MIAVFAFRSEAFFDVSTGTETLSFASKHSRADVVAIADRIERPSDFCEQLLAVRVDWGVSETDQGDIVFDNLKFHDFGVH
jgi:hypothetical protein